MSAASDYGAADWSPDGGERPARGFARWGGSLMVALGVHAAAGVAMVAWHVPVTPSEAEQPAVLLELAPLPVAPPEPAPAIDIPLPEPMPEPVIEPPPQPLPEPLPEPPPPEPEPVVEEPPPPPEPPPVVEPEVVLPKPPPEPPKPKPEVKKEAPKPRPEKPKPPRPVVQQAQPAPVAAPPAPASAPAQAPAPAPAAPAPSMAPSRAVPSWQGRVLGHLERHKRYPRSAQARRQEGVAQVRFTIDREGRVLSVQLDRTSGYSALDEETVEMVRRASPLPAPPEEMAQDRIELVVPVQFFLK